MKEIARELISAKSLPARRVLADYADQSNLRAYDPYHKVLVVADVNDWYEENQYCHVIREKGGASMAHEGAIYVDVAIVENLPECVTFAVRRLDGHTTLVLVAYESTVPVDVKNADEFSEWRETGFWKKHVQEWGDPNWNRTIWSEDKEREYQQWISP